MESDYGSESLWRKWGPNLLSEWMIAKKTWLCNINMIYCQWLYKTRYCYSFHVTQLTADFISIIICHWHLSLIKHLTIKNNRQAIDQTSYILENVTLTDNIYFHKMLETTDLSNYIYKTSQTYDCNKNSVIWLHWKMSL